MNSHDRVNTADLCDSYAHSHAHAHVHGGTVRVAQPIFRDYGKRRAFHGRAQTLRVFEDNALVRAALETPGNGDVLVIDGGGSLRTALVGGNLGKLAEANGWAGVVVHGAIRDSRELAECNVGIKALAAMPLKSAKKGEGNKNVAVTFAGITILPGEWIYADEDGLVVDANAIHLAT